MAEKFDCPLCPRAFRSEEGLRNHLVGNHTKTFDPRLFGLEVTDDKEPKLRRRGMRSVPIIRRRKPNGPGGSSTGTQLAVGTAMTNQADIIAVSFDLINYNCCYTTTDPVCCFSQSILNLAYRKR